MTTSHSMGLLPVPIHPCIEKVPLMLQEQGLLLLLHDFSHVKFFVTPWTAALQAPLSKGKKEKRNGQTVPLIHKAADKPVSKNLLSVLSILIPFMQRISKMIIFSSFSCCLNGIHISHTKAPPFLQCVIEKSSFSSSPSDYKVYE